MMRNATALSCKSAQGPPLGRGPGLGDEYNAGLVCSMLMFTVISAGAGAYNKWAHDASWQAPCSARTSSNALFIKSSYI